VASPLIPVVYSNDFAPAVVPFIIFLGGRLFHNCSWMLSNWFSAHLQRPGIPTAVNWAILPVQAVAAWFAMKMGGLVAVAAITSLTYVMLYGTFLVLFLRNQDVVGTRELYLLSGRDLKPWRALVGGLFRKGGRSQRPTSGGA